MGRRQTKKNRKRSGGSDRTYQFRVNLNNLSQADIELLKRINEQRSYYKPTHTPEEPRQLLMTIKGDFERMKLLNDTFANEDNRVKNLAIMEEWRGARIEELQNYLTSTGEIPLRGYDDVIKGEIVKLIEKLTGVNDGFGSNINIHPSSGRGNRDRTTKKRRKIRKKSRGKRRKKSRGKRRKSKNKN